jgi:hypothetical protein
MWQTSKYLETSQNCTCSFVHIRNLVSPFKGRKKINGVLEQDVEECIWEEERGSHRRLEKTE